jgi:hypothetical protein
LPPVGRAAAGRVAGRRAGVLQHLHQPADRCPPPLLFLLCFVYHPLVLRLAPAASHGSAAGGGLGPAGFAGSVQEEAGVEAPLALSLWWSEVLLLIVETIMPLFL